MEMAMAHPDLDPDQVNGPNNHNSIPIDKIEIEIEISDQDQIQTQTKKDEMAGTTKENEVDPHLVVPPQQRQ